ncbi:MAG: hypothetical protein WCP55_21940 [Lentisphaerota bacterium]
MKKSAKKSIPYGHKLPIVLKKDVHEYILKETLIEPEAFGNGKLDGNKITFQLSLDDIEYIQGFVAAEANHTKKKNVEEGHGRIFDMLQEYLDQYDDEQEL